MLFGTVGFILCFLFAFFMGGAQYLFEEINKKRRLQKWLRYRKKQ